MEVQIVIEDGDLKNDEAHTTSTEVKCDSVTPSSSALRFHPSTKEANDEVVMTRPGQSSHRRKTSKNFGRDKCGITSYRRWSSRRRMSRNYNLRRTLSVRPPISDDQDDLQIMSSMAAPTSSDAGCCINLECCIHIFPLREHGLFVAAVSVLVSLLGLVACLSLLFRNAIVKEISSLPPGCAGISQINTANGSIIFVPAPTVGTGLSSALAKSPNPSKNDNPTSQTEVKAKAVKEDSAEDKNGIGTQCSGIATFFYLLFFSSQGAGDPNQLDANLVGLDMTKWHAQLSPIILWVGVAISAFFLSSSVLLWRGIRRERRRHLLPWLLLTGVTLLMLITAAVWLVITGKAGSHLGGRAAAAGPAAAALLLLYWWLLVNDLLEELHRDKKAKAEFVVSEKIAMTTAAAAAMAAAAGIAPKRSSSGGAECNDLAETRRENTLV